jgi:subtilase family serine protease/prenyltransferase beta subunit
MKDIIKFRLYIFKVIFIVLFLLFLTSVVYAQSTQIENGLSFLNYIQNESGSWGNTESSLNTEYFSTVIALDTLKVLGEDDTSSYQSGIQWLQNEEINNTAYLAYKIYILSDSGIDISDDINMLFSYKNPDDTWGGFLNYTSSNFHTALAFQALMKLNIVDENTPEYAIPKPLGYLFSTQNADGGWGLTESSESDVYITAKVLKILTLLDDIYNLQTKIDNAVAYLISKQNTDGGFGSSPSTVYETALVLESLVASYADLSSVSSPALNYLYNTQLPDGSWGEDPYSTALALKALANIKPNPFISATDINASNFSPTVGETIELSVTVHNNGPEVAENVLVHFFDGDPGAGGVFIGEATVVSVPAYGSSQTSISWTVPTASSRTIYVKIDPSNSIDELKETDNIAFRNLTIANLPDVSVTSGDVVIFPPSPYVGLMTGIFIKVRNHGETDASNVLVEVYNGDPANGGVKLNGGGTYTIPAGGYKETVAAMLPMTGGSKDIYILVDPNNTVLESNETNNTAVKTFIVGAAVDLGVSSKNISFNPVNPMEGDLVEISAKVTSWEYGRAENVVVRFYLGDPENGGVQIGTDQIIPSIYGRGHSETVSMIWDTTGHIGNNDIYVWADPDDVINEEYESNAYLWWGVVITNNIGSKTLKVSTSQGPDLTLTSSDIAFSPSSPVKGDIVTITATIRNIGNQDAYNVPVEFSNGNPEEGGTTIFDSQTISYISAGETASVQTTLDTSAFSGTYDIYVNADPYNEISEMNELNNMAHIPLTVQGQGPDLAISSIDTTNLITDFQSLDLSGTVQVAISNIGDQPVNTPFLLTIFEDKDNDGILDRVEEPYEGDNILGEVTYSNTLMAGTTDTVEITLSGSVLFRDSIIYAVADPDNTVDELDETNNMRNTGQECEFAPPAGAFSPVVKWHWEGSPDLPEYNQSCSPPVVARLTDTNSDGIVDEKDVPAIIFLAHPRSYSACANACGSILVAVRGDTGEEIFTVTDPDYMTTSHSGPAVGDIDNDGYNEIIVKKYGGGYIAFEHDGTFKWQSTSIMNYKAVVPSLADLDGDGTVEIIVGRVVFNNDGTIRWSGTQGIGLNSYAVLSTVADLDLDGQPEVVTGKTAYRNDGTIYWNRSTSFDGLTAIANFDDDPYPEVVVVGSGRVMLLEHDGVTKWLQNLPGGGYGGAPTVADFDGDGELEIGVAGLARYVVFNADGSILWQNTTQDKSSSLTGSSVFDFDGDGRAEVAYGDEQHFRVYDGLTGFTLFEMRNSSNTGIELPVIADVDNDNRAEIIQVATDWLPGSLINGEGLHGIRVFEDLNDNWVNTRKIWNQHAYHITNVNDDGSIPRVEQNNWEIYNNYRCNSLLPEEILQTADLTVSYIRVDLEDFPATVSVTARIGNGGAVSHPAGLEVAFFDGDPLQGGTLIGTAYTTGVLNKGVYEDVSIIWESPPEGTHTIFVVADKDDLFNECRENNNTASAEFAIEVPPPPVYLPDLSVIQENITIIPPDVIEGQDASIGVVVYNEGDLIAYNIEVAFYDGDASIGDLIGTAYITSIVPEGTSYVQVPWSTYGQSGRNYIHVIADPQNLIEEHNENNNASLVSIDVSPPAMPDLTVTSTDISFSHLTPKEGDPLIITMTVHNIGTSADTIKVDLYDGNPGTGGTLLDTFTIATIIPFGGQAEITFNINTLGFTGNHCFHVMVDPDNSIAEQREDNNSASADLLIGTIGLNITETTDKTQYNENEDVLITVNVTDLQNETRELQVDVKVFDANGYLAASLDPVLLTVNPLATETVNFIWNTGVILTGNYTVRTTVYDAVTLNPVAMESVPISIVASAGISSNLVLDKISYNANEQVTITSTVTNDSANEIYEDLTVTVTIQDSLSQVLFTEDTAIGMLTPAAYQSFNTYWNTSTNPPGDYPVTLEVKDSGGIVLSTSTKILTITDVIDPSALLIGDISVDTQSLFQGDPVNISYSITNIGNIDLSQVDLSILTVHVVELTPYDTLTDQTALLRGETYNNTQLLNTPTYSAKDYLVILRANISGTEETLAGTYFRVEGAPSAPSLSSPGQGDDVETYTPVLEVNNSSDPNDDELTYEFELYSDSGLTNLVSSSGVIEEGAGVTSWQVPVELLENETYYWRVRAYDQLLYGEWMTTASFRVNTYNDLPTAPTLSSPANDSEVDTFTPVLVVNNSYDPDSTDLTYNFEVASDPDFLNIVTSVIGVFEGDGTTSWQIPDSILSENTHYYWRVQADDWLDEGPWMDTAMFFVNTANDAPSAPTVISPLDDSEITALSTDIIVSNSTDPDYDPLTYVFQIDTMNTFDSPNLTQSGNIPEGLDTTSWYVEGLFDNTYHYVRTLADDSLAQSPWSGTIRFFANTANDAPAAPVLANPSDGAGVSVYNPTLSVHNSEDIDLDVLTYDFEVYDNTMTSLISSVTGVEETPVITSWTVPMDLTENETYTWRARAYDAELYSGWMPFASFMINTANDAPTKPTLNAPADGSSVETEYPTLSVNNADDSDSDTITYVFEIYSNGTLVDTYTGIPEDDSGITSVTLMNALSDNTTYTWKARAYDGDRYGAWMDTATFTVHLPIVNITATIDFDPNTLDQKSKGKWVTVYIELPEGYDVNDIIVSSILFENTVPVEPWPYAIEDYDNDGIPDLKVKFNRAAVIDILPAGDHVPVLVTGELATVTFDGIDIIRVIH